MRQIVPCLWFDGQAEEAAEFYCSLFPDAKIVEVVPYGDAGPGEPGAAMTVVFELMGTQYVGLNGGPQFRFNEAVSFQIHCDDQAEVDRLWAALTEGGEEGPCGWLKDRWGLSWQVTPVRLLELVQDRDPERARRAMEAMFAMKKIDIAAVERAADAA
ncbi:VOC family protein [Pseudonocardia sp.]|uniref:VOC family protein n=1 Tax=Pseudonocardia sp. TaxID=60912 RepID=UPI003D1243AC